MKVTPASIVRDDIQKLSAYQVQKSDGMIKLDAMENPFGLPDSLKQSISNRLSEVAVNRYPNPSAPALQAKLRQCMQIPDEAAVMLGNGSDELLHVMLTACARPNAVVMTPSPGFVMYHMYSLYLGLRFVEFSLDPDFNLDAGKFIETMREVNPAVVFIAYPNNPTGNSFREDDLIAIIRQAPGLVVIDEAYQPFASGTFLPRVLEFPNLVVLRTLSKLGLAGIRLGYAIGRPDWISQFDKVRSPYNVNSLTQCYAECVLENYQVLLEQAERICVARSDLTRRLKAMSQISTFHSDANFLTIRVPDAPGLFNVLKTKGILVKNLHGAHPILHNCLRVTIGTEQENGAFMDVVREFLGEPKNGVTESSGVR